MTPVLTMQMTADELLAAFRLPAESLVGLRVTKKELGERLPTPADRRLVSDLVESCTWVAVLKPTTCGLAAVRDSEREYTEIAILRLVQRSPEHRPRLHEALHRVIPYPVVLISSASTTPAPHLSLAHKRRSAGTTATGFLAGEVVSTDDVPLVEAFTDSLVVGAGDPADLYACYDGWIARIEALHIAALTGVWAVPRTSSDLQRRRSALATYTALDAERLVLIRRAEVARQMSARVDCNLAIQALRQRLNALLPDLNLEPTP